MRTKTPTRHSGNPACTSRSQVSAIICGGLDADLAPSMSQSVILCKSDAFMRRTFAARVPQTSSQQQIKPGEGRTGLIFWQVIYNIDIIYCGDGMRTLIDIGDIQIQALDELSKKEKRSRAALIRQAIDDYLRNRRDEQEGDAFGLWGKRKVDGLAYQEKVRREW